MTILGSLKLELAQSSPGDAVLENILTGEQFIMHVGDGILIEVELVDDLLNVNIETYESEEGG
ncbi:hypothetical protein ES705_35502 [subsurface metagenome]